jgi:large subunit ribosomal protein L21
MFAVLETGGRQYTVSEGNSLDIGELGLEKGSRVLFEKILMAEDASGRLFVGKPEVAGVTVEAEVLENFRERKVTIFKMRRRKNSRTGGGHRQPKTRVRITSLVFSSNNAEEI